VRKQIVIAALTGLTLGACAHTTAHGKNELKVGMTTDQVRNLLGTPDDRSFRENNEALQYYDVVGVGQCEYLTVWFTDGVVRAVTSRRGSSVAGCGLGSQPIDWGQMPKPTIDVNVNVKASE
jgi:hypothetical protein